jgi:hypothetical protein
MIRDYRKGDEEEITALFQEVFEKEMTREQWYWKFAVTGEGRVYSKVVEDTSHRIIAHAGAIPLKGIYKNTPIQFFQVVDVMVHPEARGFLGRKNVFEHNMKFLFEDLREEFHEIFCYGFPGYRQLLLGMRVRVYHEIEQAFDCIRETKRVFWTPFTIKAMDWNDERLDALWSHCSRNFRLSVIRDRAYLNWRYVTNPFFSYQLLGLFHKGDLKGWVVVRDSGDTVLIIDLLTKPKRYMSMLRALENHLVPLKKKAIHFWLPERWRKHIKDYILKEHDAFVSNMIWKLPIKTSTAKESLYYTMGDVDIF